MSRTIRLDIMSERLRDIGHKPKRVWITILLAIVLPGAGHFYLHRYRRGLVMMTLVIISSVVPVILAVILTDIMYGIGMEPDISSALVKETISVLTVFAIFLLPIGLSIWQIIDAYKICKRHNLVY